MEWQKVYVLHQRHFSDSRYWVDLITQDYGKVSVIWRKNKKSPPLIPFTPYQAHWASRSQFKILSACEAMGGPIGLEDKALFCGFYVNELCERLLLLDDSSTVPFLAYEEALMHLASSPMLEMPLRTFEWKLICHLGFEFSFAVEGYTSDPIRADRWYKFNPHTGFESVGSYPIANAFYGNHLLAIGSGEMDSNLFRMLKAILRSALQHRLGSKPLKSREFFQ